MTTTICQRPYWLREELLLIQWDNLRKLYAGDETADARVLILQKAQIQSFAVVFRPLNPVC